VSWTATTNAVYGANSLFAVAFQVTAPVAYSFDANLMQAHTDFNGASSSSYALVRLVHFLGVESEDVIAFQTDSENVSAISRSVAGMLVPGQYSLGVQALSFGFLQGTGTASSGYTFSMDFAAADAPVVPEPASLLLVGTGVAGLAARRRRRKLPRLMC
jgi:hypothetical protein